MTDIERKVASSLQYVTFLPGSFDKRFSLQLSNWKDKEMTQKGRDMMLHLFHKYKRQIPNYLNLKAQLPKNEVTK